MNNVDKEDDFVGGLIIMKEENKNVNKPRYQSMLQQRAKERKRTHEEMLQRQEDIEMKNREKLANDYIFKQNSILKKKYSNQKHHIFVPSYPNKEELGFQKDKSLIIIQQFQLKLKKFKSN